MLKRILTPTLALAAMSNAAMAHPGDHGFSLAASLFHLLTEPDHLAMIVGAVVLAAAAWRWKVGSRA
jgi:hydrogenase/urease accessory protein HupE